MATNPVTPIYPESLDPVTLRCNLQDTTTNEPTINRRVTLFYTWVSTNGAATNSASLAMTNAPGALDDYSAVVSGLDAGTNQYYFRCDFDGYYYTNSDKRGPYYLSASGQTSTNTIPTNRFSYQINAANVRAIRLLPLTDLAFGQCATNDTRVRTLRICNDGNMPLAVTNIVFGGPDFTTSFTTNFDVAVNSTQSVTVTFAPASLGAYSDWLWVQSDKTTGTDSNLVTGYGMPVESVTTPAVVGTTAGTLGESLSFDLSPAATDSWGYVVETAYDWGDGTTSAWSVVTATNHSWNTNGTFYVRAQGRSSTNTTILSDWSASVTVTITNTRIMALTGNLDFGAVGVGAQALSRLLIVTNSGNGPLTVSDVTSADPVFSCTPTNFVIPAFGSSNVTVTFAPSAINAYTSLITVVSDMTSGWNTTNATGVGEQLAVIALDPPTSTETLLPQQLTFTVVGSNSSAHAMNYRFDWGDGSISGWSALTNASHGWTNAGLFSVMAQAQCQTDTNALSPWSAPVSVTITNTRILGLNGNLSFGIVVTNLSSNLVLAVTNSGNGSLSVSDITITNTFFSILSATSFELPPFGGTNVTVRFLPTAPGYYTDLVVVAANNTSGSNTIKVTGIGEMVGKPTISPTNTAGTLGQNIAFTADATNNTDNLFNYRFDWGTGATSDWTSATATNAWYETNTFSIRAQAQCRTHTNALSEWSDAATLTITNARSVSLSATNLFFGDLMTNQTRDVILIISNSGNASFAVTSITPPAGFSVLPQAFTIPVSNSVVVTNTFAPSTPGSYSGTVVITSPEAGGRIYTVTGFCETISAPVLSGILGGHTNDTLAFSVVATNNSGHTNQYLYSWGDGQTSGWTTIAATSHVWTTSNAFPVLVQARCQAYTNVVSAWSATNIVNVYDAPVFTFSTVTNGLPFQVTMTATGAAPGTVSNSVFYFLPPGSTNVQATNLTFVSGNDWTALIPPLNSGSMGYYLRYMRSSVALRYPVASNNSFSITNFLGVGRQIGFEETWTSYGAPDFNWTGPSGWTGTYMQVSTGLRTPPLNDTTYAMRLYNGSNSLGQMGFIMSPLIPAGVGTIYFDVGIKNTSAGWSAGFSVQVSTNNGATWDTFYTNYVSGMTVLHPAVVVNVRQPVRVRIQRTTYSASDTGNNTSIVIDNLIISPPPTDVLITELLKNPGYPNSKDPTRVRCQTADYDPVNAPSVSRRLTVCYRHENGSTASNSMYATGSSTYEGVIPVLPPGVVQYYFKCDFDGYFYTNSVITNVTPPYPSERINPSYLPDQRPGPVNATYPTPTKQVDESLLPDLRVYSINLFRSEHDRIYLQTTPSSIATDMKLVDDYTWQATTRITGITNITWYFTGSNPYSNDATAFGPTLYWGDNNQDFPYPPMGGTADLTTNLTTNAMHAALEYDGLLLYQFVTTNANYLVKRAVFQDFDTWQAQQDYFLASLGLYGITILTENYSTWGTNYFNRGETWKWEDFQSEPVNVPYNNDYTLTANKWWNYQDAMVTNEPTPNQALMLNNSTAAQGGVWNDEEFGLTWGIHNFGFRARLAQNDGRSAVYTAAMYDSTWATGYRVTNILCATSMSPAKPSLSLLLCFSPATRLYYYNYYELRLTQETAANSLNLQLYRWVNGVPLWIKNETKTNGRLDDSIPFLFDVYWTNASGKVQFNVNVSRTNGVALFAWKTNECQDAAAGALTNGGTVGFLCSDAEAQIRSLGVYRGTNLNEGSLILSNQFTSTGWYLGATDVLPDCWTNAAGSLTRSIPADASRLAFKMLRAGTEGSRDPDVSKWPIIATNSVTSFSYANYSQSLNFWDKSFVMLKFASGSLPIVLDDLVMDPWRAYTRGFADSNWVGMAKANGVEFWNWTNSIQQAIWAQTDPGWLITEGLIVRGGVNTYASLDRSRANPSLDQGVWCPILTNGLGSLAFHVWVGAGTSVYRVEATSTNDPSVWHYIQTFTNTAADATVTNPVQRNVFVGFADMLWPGRIRIKQLANSSSNAILNIDNLVAYDYPRPDNTTWQAYNCLIASLSANPSTADKAFDPSSNSVLRTCYLNNSPTNGVLTPLDQNNPYVQTPFVETGIGEIAFWYRAWATNQPAYISIQVAPSATTPADQWRIVDSFVVTNGEYQYYDNKDVFDLDNHVMRVYVTNSIPYSTTGRLCIDNILMAEPVRAGFEITGVTLLPSQPLATDAVGVQATIGRFLMNPQGIRMYLSYVIGTNTWGYTNWWGSGVEPNPGIPRLELSNTADRVYTSLGTNFIPAMNIDTVVQFMVWGSYSNMVGRPFFQGSNTFSNPSWYTPVNLNTSYVSKGWSPYYYVYSCPPGSVWINEVNYAVTVAERTNEYIELIGPTSVNIGKWRISLLNSAQTVITNNIITNNYTLTNTSYNGWSFFVWGDTAVVKANIKFSPPSANNIPTPGAAKLYRSMGAVEDMVCWDSASQTNYGYRYAGAKTRAAPLALQDAPLPFVSGSNKYDFVWSLPSSGNYTPGLPNTDQTLSSAPVIPTFLYCYLTSLVGPHGRQNGSSNAMVSVQLSLGASTSITYTADSWYRIGTLTSNGSGIPAASGTNQYTWSVTNISGNVSNNATFSILPDGLNGQGVPTLWLAGFGQTESAAYDSDIYGVQNEYLLNMNPYVSNAISFAVDAIAVTGATVNVTVRLLESVSGGAYNAQPYIYGTLHLYAATNLTGGEWTSVASQSPTNVFDGTGRKLFSFPADSNTFYRAQIQ